MSSFYKTNLKNGYDSLLNPPENDLKKENAKIEADVEGKNSVQNPKLRVSSIDYPYKTVIVFSRIAIIFSIFMLFIWSASVVSPRISRFDNHGRNVSQNILDPCNERNVVSLKEVEKIKFDIESLNIEKRSINDVLKYNISTFTNKYLEEKYANLTRDSDTLKIQFEEQKEIRFICYKKNLMDQCEYNKSLKPFANILCAYICLILILLTIGFYYISKARKTKLSDEQKESCDNDFYSFITIIFFYIFMAVVSTILSTIFSSFFPCDVERELERFPYYFY